MLPVELAGTFWTRNFDGTGVEGKVLSKVQVKWTSHVLNDSGISGCRIAMIDSMNGHLAFLQLSDEVLSPSRFVHFLEVSR